MNYLVIVGNSGSLTAMDTWVQNRLTGQGHTVTIIDDGAAAPGTLNADYNAVIITGTANKNQIVTKYDATTRGVFSVTSNAYPHSQYSSQASASGGGASTNAYVRVTTPDVIIPSGSLTNVTILSSNGNPSYVDSSTLGSGATLVLAARNDLLARTTGARYTAGALMADGSTTAPSRRLCLSLGDVTLLNATGQTWFDNAVTWVNTNRPPVANAGSAQTVNPNTLVTLDGTASSDPDGTIAGYSWSQASGPAVTLSSASAAQPTFTAPASITGATLSFNLQVTDNGGGTSSAAAVTITVRASASVKARVAGAWVTKPLKSRVGGSWVN